MRKKNGERYSDTSSPHKEFGIETPYHAGRKRRKENLFTGCSPLKNRKKDRTKKRIVFGIKNSI